MTLKEIFCFHKTVDSDDFRPLDVIVYDTETETKYFFK